MHPYCRISPLLILLLTPHASAAPADPAQTCASYNQQSHRSAERLDRELQIANSPLLAGELAAGRNPKLAPTWISSRPMWQCMACRGDRSLRASKT